MTVIKRSSLLFSLALLFAATASALGDTSHVLSAEAFLGIVRQFHPVVRSAAIQIRRAEAGILSARGAFDPTLNAGFDQKTLDGKTYYQYLRPELNIPTWYGLELIAGAEDVRGVRVNPEATIGTLSYAGLKLNVSGIWTDTRRTALRQAQALRTQTEAERSVAINNLLYDALSAYYNWQREAAIVSIIRSSLENARDRVRFVRIEYEQGARPAIDTIEALAQQQTIEQLMLGAENALRNAFLEMGNYLWLEDGTPLPATVALEPQPQQDTMQSLMPVEAFVSQALNNHPKLAALQSKIDVLSLEQRLKASYLVPKLSIKATGLSKGYSVIQDASTAYLEANSKLSADLRIPLFMREARGAYRAAGLKIDETSLERDAASLSIANSIRAAYNDYFTTRAQLLSARAMLDNYNKLYQGERMRLEGGESTLFLINTRQNKVIEAAQKIAELEAKQGKAAAKIFYAAGMLL